MAAPEAHQFSVDNINGRLTEMAEINAYLTGRVVEMRGLVADQQRQLSDQNEVIAKQAARIKELEAVPVIDIQTEPETK